jgi:hypothetical protein
MANGFRLGILQHIKDVNKDATPQYKIEPYGLLGSLKVAHSPGVIKYDTFDGHRQTVKIKKKKRFTVDDTWTEPSCDITLLQPYSEDTVDVSQFRQIAVSVEDETIEQYDAFASAIVNGTSTKPATPMMFELLDNVMSAASAILSGVNQDLWALAAAAVGDNRRTGNNTAASINLPLNATNNPLGDGVNQIRGDWKLNTMNGKIITIGQGLFYNWIASQPSIGGVNQAGVDTRIQAQGFDFWYDAYVASALSSANQILCYEKDAIQLVEFMKNRAWKAGDKPGDSTFGIITLPMQSGDQLVPVEFDYQLRYFSCPTDLTIGYNGETQEMDRGYQLILSKRFGLWTIPTDAYRTGDPLEGNRGSLRYAITNT